jgi:hypothetical protein
LYRACIALRIRVNNSAIGSVCDIKYSPEPLKVAHEPA